MSDWDETIERGRHIYGVLPDGTVTGVLCHPRKDDVFYESYIEGPGHPRFPRWEQHYERTPLGIALEEFAREGPLGDLAVLSCYYEGREYEGGGMEGGCLTGWRYEYERKVRFKRQVLRGNIELPAPAIFNRYGNVWIQEGYGEQVQDLYWEFVESNYEHRMSHYSDTKTHS